MAEIVQLRLEDSIGELEQMERVGLFTATEIRTVVKKRKHFEYRIQRRIKTKEDFLQYISYELNLLNLIGKRRKKIGYHFKKEEIDYSIAHRISSLFRFAIARHQFDIKLWLSHIEFCKRMRWSSYISKVFTKMLKVLSHFPGAWVAAAKYEMEENKGSETARQLLLRGLRFNPDSKLIYKEYFKLELMYADQIRKRQEMIGLKDMEIDDATSDAVLSSKLAEVVYKDAVKTISDVDFHLSLLNICKEFAHTEKLQNLIWTDFLELHKDKAKRWEALAKSELEDADLMEATGHQGQDNYKAMKKLEKKCIAVFKEAVEAVPTEEMWTLYLKTSMELLNKKGSAKLTKWRLSQTLSTFSEADNKSLLSPDLYVDWIVILDAVGQENEIDAILEKATDKYPTNINLWQKRLTNLIRNKADSKEIHSLFNLSLQKVPEKESFPLWKTAIEWQSLINPENVPKLFKKHRMLDPKVGAILKDMYLEWMVMFNGISATRELFNRLCNDVPITETFFQKMYYIENIQPFPAVDELRKVLETALFHFGKNSIEFWLQRVKLELNHQDGDPTSISQIHWRAVKTLLPQLADKFIAEYVLLNTGMMQMK